MTKRYPLRGALGRGDSRDSRDFEGVALGIFETAHGGERGDLLGGDVHHFYFAALSVVREFRHGSSLPQQNGRISTEGTEFAWRVRRRAHTISLRSKMGTVSPTSMRDRPAATTRKQLACASAMMSPEPCQRSALTCGVVPLHSTRAGRKCARPGFSCSASPSPVSTRSYFPIDTPPERTRTSSFRPRSILARRPSTRSAALPSGMGSPPASRTCTASE